jgi:hypothetical protein
LYATKTNHAEEVLNMAHTGGRLSPMATKKKQAKKRKSGLRKTAPKRKSAEKNPVKKKTPKKLVTNKKSTPKKKVAKKSVARKAGIRTKSVAKKSAKRTSGTRTTGASRKRGRGQSVNIESFTSEETRALSAGQSGGLQGLSDAASADSESVDELIEEGNAFEAGVVSGVEAADRADGKEVRTHEVPEDDVPGEYLDED